MSVGFRINFRFNCKLYMYDTRVKGYLDAVLCVWHELGEHSTCILFALRSPFVIEAHDLDYSSLTTSAILGFVGYTKQKGTAVA